MKVIGALAVLVLAIALAVAGLRANANATTSSPQSQTAVSSQDETFLKATQQYNLAEQAFGKIAQQRGQSTQTAELAATTIDDHKAAETKVADLAKSLSVTLPTEPTSFQQSEAEQLQSVASSSFDLAYAENQVTGHNESIAGTQQEISDGTNSGVVSYAKSFLSVEESHLRLAQSQLDSMTGSDSTSDGSSSPSAVPAGNGGRAARPSVQINTAPNSSAAPTPPAPRRAPHASASGAGPGPPTLLELPSIDVTASVVPVGVSDGELGVPGDPAKVGWWITSAEAGADTGSVIIDGHVDTARQGLGALFRMGIGDLQVGDRVTVTTVYGHRVDYRIYAEHVYVKAAHLPSDVLAQTRAPRLVLITCGGPFDARHRSYEDNVVVYARPVSS